MVLITPNSLYYNTETHCPCSILGLKSELNERCEKEKELVEALHKQTDITDALKKEAKKKVEGKETELNELRKIMDEMSQNLQQFERSTESLKEEKEREEEKVLVCNTVRNFNCEISVSPHRSAIYKGSERRNAPSWMRNSRIWNRLVTCF